jgi:hypothetical protein
MNDPVAGMLLVVKVTLDAFDAREALEKKLFPTPTNIPDRAFSSIELASHDGRKSPTVYISVRGYVPGFAGFDPLHVIG